MAKDGDEPGYRWVMVAIATIILAVSMGQIVNGLSVYFVPLESGEGWRRGEIALINSSGLVGVALGSLLMGFAADRYGVRPVAILGIFATGIGTLLASRAAELWQLYGLFFLVGMLGGGSLSAPIMAAVGGWFRTGAGLAIGLVAAGQALGQGGMPFTGAFLIEAFGWRGAMAAQGALTLVLLLPLSLFLRDPPAPPGKTGLSTETPSGLPNNLITGWLALAALFCCTCMAVPLIHLVPMIQGKGFAAAEAGGVLFWMLTVAVIGRAAFGRIADMIGAVPSWLIASGRQTVMVVGFIGLTQIDHFYIYATIYGFGYAGVRLPDAPCNGYTFGQVRWELDRQPMAGIHGVQFILALRLISNLTRMRRQASLT